MSIAKEMEKRTRFKFDFPKDLDLMAPSDLIGAIEDEISAEQTQVLYGSASEFKKSLLLRLHRLRLDLEAMEEEDQ